MYLEIKIIIKPTVHIHCPDDSKNADEDANGAFVRPSSAAIYFRIHQEVFGFSEAERNIVE